MPVIPPLRAALRRATPTRVALHRARLRLAARPLRYWLLSGALAAGLAAMVGHTTASGEAARRQWGHTTTVLVATRDLRPGDPLDTSAVVARALPRAMVAEGSLARVPAGAVVAAPIARGEPVNALRIGRGGASAVAALLPPGTRGVALAVGHDLPLGPGDRVDVVATLSGTVVATAATVVHVGDGSAVVAVPVAALGAVAAAVADGGALVALG